jgi:glyoxylase-like metal-dependent hydrolase (beta-lactamase superfamily II)
MAAQLTLVEDGQEVLPGIAAWLTPGHTPGHMAFELRSGDDSVMILGDAIGNHHVGFERPLWETASDQDPAQAATTRAAILDRLSHEQMRFVGFHLPGGGLGRAEKGPDGFRFIEA